MIGVAKFQTKRGKIPQNAGWLACYTPDPHYRLMLHTVHASPPKTKNPNFAHAK